MPLECESVAVDAREVSQHVELVPHLRRVLVFIGGESLLNVSLVSLELFILVV